MFAWFSVLFFFLGVFFLSFLPPADCCCGLLMVGLKGPLTFLSGNSQTDKLCSSLFKLLWTAEFLIPTKQIYFTFCVCFTFQHLL